VHRGRAGLLSDVRVPVPAASRAARGRRDAGAEGGTATMDVPDDRAGRRARSARRARVQRVRRPPPAGRAPRLRGPIWAHQPPVPVPVVRVHCRLHVPRRRLRVRHRVRRNHRRVAEEETRGLRQLDLVDRLLRSQDRATLVPAPVRTLCNQKGIIHPGRMQRPPPPCTSYTAPSPNAPAWY